MKTGRLDWRLIFSIVLAHLLLFFSFQEKTVFWYIFTGSVLVLVIFSMFQGEVDDKVSFLKYILIGALSGGLLYFLFWLGHAGIELLNLPFQNEIGRLYRRYAPSEYWQYLALLLVAAPGEELFWRGFVLKRLLKYFGPFTSILIAAILYASAHIYSGTFLLVFSALVSGFVWGVLYQWKRSMPLIIVSHIVFDLLIFIVMPF